MVDGWFLSHQAWMRTDHHARSRTSIPCDVTSPRAQPSWPGRTRTRSMLATSSAARRVCRSAWRLGGSGLFHIVAAGARGAPAQAPCRQFVADHRVIGPDIQPRPYSLKPVSAAVELWLIAARCAVRNQGPAIPRRFRSCGCEVAGRRRVLVGAQRLRPRRSPRLRSPFVSCKEFGSSPASRATHSSFGFSATSISITRQARSRPALALIRPSCSRKAAVRAKSFQPFHWAARLGASGRAASRPRPALSRRAPSVPAFALVRCCIEDR